MSTHQRAFKERLRGTNQGTVFSIPNNSKTVAFVNVYVAAVTGNGISRTGSIKIGSSVYGINSSTHASSLGGSHSLSSLSLSGMLLAGESLEIQSSSAVQWEVDTCDGVVF